MIFSSRNCFSFFAVVLILLTITTVASAQSINLSVTPETRNHSFSLFRIGDNSVLLQENVVKYLSNSRQFSGFLTYGISPDQTTLGFLMNEYDGSKAVLLNSAADTLLSYEPSEIQSDDPSLAIYPYSDGRSIVRQNIGRFVFYDALGNARSHYSSVTGSQGGEVISKMASDPNGQTVVIYNPEVIQNGKHGSRAHLAQSGEELQRFYYSPDRVIEKVRVTDNGQFIGILTHKKGTNRQVIIFDRYGNEINSMRFEDDIKDFSLSNKAATLLVYSGSRALVYEVLSGEKVGSTSFRSSVVFADYYPEDHVLLALSGRFDETKGEIRDTKFHAIHLQQREIESKSLGSSLGRHQKIGLQLTRKNAYSYLLTGASKEVAIEVAF